MRRSGIVRLNLIEILRAASNACLNLLEISLLWQIYSPAAPVNFTHLRALCLATASFRRAPGFKTEYDRFKFHGTIGKPYDPKEMRAHHLLNFTTRLANGVRNRALFCALKFYRVVHGAFKFSRFCKARKFNRFCKARKF